MVETAATELKGLRVVKERRWKDIDQPVLVSLVSVNYGGRG